MNWLAAMVAAERAGDCMLLPEGPLAGSGRAVALAPHPDDPDAVAVFLRMLQRGGWDVCWTILTSGWSGVEDDFVGLSREAKSRVREDEERAAARLFGLPDERLTFLRLAEGEDGHLVATPRNYARFAVQLEALAPALVILPYHDDSNPSHRLTSVWLRQWLATRDDRPVVVENEDPKSTTFLPNLCIRFDEDTAGWKSTLLECHRSQSVRNQHARGITFAERILRMNAGPERAAGFYQERYHVTTALNFDA